MAAAVVQSPIRLGGSLSSSETPNLTISLLKAREILFQQALSKLGVIDRTQAVIVATKRGLVSL